MVSRRLLAALSAAAALLLLPGGTLEAETKETVGIVPAGRDGLKGVVSDIVTGEPLIGAGILIEGTSRGTVTDLDGTYVLPLSQGTHTLSVTYIGYTTVTLDITVGPDGNGKVQAPDDTSIALTGQGW